MAQRNFLLVSAALRAIAGIVEDRDAGEKPVIAGFIGDVSAPLDASDRIGAGVEEKCTLIARRARDDVDDAMDRVGAIGRARGTAHDLDAPGDFCVRFEEFVDIGKAGRAQRHAVFKVEKRPRPRPAGQHRRADRRQMFLSVAAMNEDAGAAIEGFGRVVG